MLNYEGSNTRMGERMREGQRLGGEGKKLTCCSYSNM